ncbi:uncharacterized protein 4930519G04Rikl isoform X1 [Rattus norvegicus]|uniref:uncharacterized protein 4930519G04Rikl isoform X1 n=1 Tax=Rattus norvegicus TaxID=10116 RepID=UPI0003D0ACDB|nr:uncharacterized protein LOC691311 isoform X1 [Rattus norvegicus]XP_017454029.1 uncharacterized protein LOC691311 isoform X1 [Rattus norvegicus]XP_017454030.1 uncharacterized protein LOC691311 isoform X1 [Rattus norvegicus]|eukprot:XP_006249553.1 PREDICTED: uncharacterized protein LOC691311 isoform X2 [Rattus norvegicus]
MCTDRGTGAMSVEILQDKITKYEICTSWTSPPRLVLTLVYLRNHCEGPASSQALPPDTTTSWSLSWYIQKYVSWILRIRKEGTETGCCVSDDDVPQRKRHFSHGTRIRLWPPSRVEPTYPSDVSNRVIMEVVPCVSSEEEDEESVGKVESADKENIILENLRDSFHPHRRSEESIKYPNWNVQRQWDWSSDEEDCEGHSISVTALVHAEACLSDTEEEEKAEEAIKSQDEASREGGDVAPKTEAAAL